MPQLRVHFNGQQQHHGHDVDVGKTKGLLYWTTVSSSCHGDPLAFSVAVISRPSLNQVGRHGKSLEEIMIFDAAASHAAKATAARWSTVA
jgi:hypothetical protein